MKKWIVRFVSLLVFNVVVLLVIGFLTPARVGWNALWAGIVMTALVIFIKPIVQKLFSSFATRKAGDERSRMGEKLSEFVVALGVAFVIWVGTVLLSGVRVGGGILGFVFGYLLPPVILVVGWAIYDVIDDRIEAQTGSLYDRATTRRGHRSAATTGAAPAIPQAPSAAARREARDGLTEEQRRMLDELGRS